jgi:hypothetical protein
MDHLSHPSRRTVRRADATWRTHQLVRERLH